MKSFRKVKLGEIAGFPQGLENMENREKNNGQVKVREKSRNFILDQKSGNLFILGQKSGYFFPESLNAAISIINLLVKISRINRLTCISIP